jgi:ribosomal protein S18 acetylase RimI-like enzyme
MLSPLIRRACDADLAGVRACLVETWHGTYDAIYGADEVTRMTDRWHALDVLRGQLAREDHTFLVVELGGRIVATALLHANGTDTVQLRRLYVLPVFQGRAIGRGLLEACVYAAGAATSMRLEVVPANIKAIAFYERLGFRRVGADDAADTLIFEAPLPLK